MHTHSINLDLTM